MKTLLVLGTLVGLPLLAACATPAIAAACVAGVFVALGITVWRSERKA
ncbi:MAG: hypothetical protein WC718_00380 [Phycisphaerales bacterium]|jgi:hypothetical protein